jgi:hypothetical protein
MARIGRQFGTDATARAIRRQVVKRAQHRKKASRRRAPTTHQTCTTTTKLKRRGDPEKMRQMKGLIGGTALVIASASGLGGCAAHDAPAIASPASATSAASTAPTATARPELAAAQVDCTVSDGAGKMLLEGSSFFDDHANGVELDHGDATTVRRLKIVRYPDAKEGGLVLALRYIERRKNDDTTIELQPMVRVAEKGRSEIAIKLPGGEERRFAISAR